MDIWFSSIPFIWSITIHLHTNNLSNDFPNRFIHFPYLTHPDHSHFTLSLTLPRPTSFTLSSGLHYSHLYHSLFFSCNHTSLSQFFWWLKQPTSSLQFLVTNRKHAKGEKGLIILFRLLQARELEAYPCF